MQLDEHRPLLLAPGEGETVTDRPERTLRILGELDDVIVTWFRDGCESPVWREEGGSVTCVAAGSVRERTRRAPVQPATQRTLRVLALGDASRAAELCSEQGGELRAAGQAFAGFAIASAGDLAERPWLALLAAAGDAAAAAGEDVRQRVERELELLPAKERRRHQREGVEAQRRLERRARTRTLDLALSLVELWLRDVLCVCEGAHELIHALDRAAELERHARGCDPARVRRAIDLVRDARLSFALNVSEELALEALAYRLGGRSGERAEIGL